MSYPLHPPPPWLRWYHIPTGNRQRSYHDGVREHHHRQSYPETWARPIDLLGLEKAGDGAGARVWCRYLFSHNNQSSRSSLFFQDCLRLVYRDWQLMPRDGLDGSKPRPRGGVLFNHAIDRPTLFSLLEAITFFCWEVGEGTATLVRLLLKAICLNTTPLLLHSTYLTWLTLDPVAHKFSDNKKWRQPKI